MNKPPNPPIQPGPSTTTTGVDPATATQMNKFRSYVITLADPNSKDDVKLKASQEINENFEMITASPLYGSFLDHSVKIFLKILQDGDPYFISEYTIQQVRKVILELLHRLPTNDLLRPYVKAILSVMLKLLEVENEENVLVCLKIIIELHKQYRPVFNADIKHFLQFVKAIYSVLPNHMNKIFEPKAPIKVRDLMEIDIPELLKETFTITVIQTEKRNKDGTSMAYNLIPKGVLSLKVLQELPIIVVLMYQLYKQSVHQDVSDFIPLIMTTITLQPTQQQRAAENFNKEIFVDFMGAQVKTLSFLAYIIKIYQEVVANHSSMMVQGMLQLLSLCPMEVAHLRRELLIAARHILATDLRNKFVPHIEQLFNEDILLGRGWTTNESLRPLAYSTLADLVHHVRTQLQLADLARAVHLFSKNVHDDSVATTIQTMSCKLLLNLVDCIRVRSEAENSVEGKELLMRMLEVFVLKFKTIAKIQLPILVNKCKQAQSQNGQNIGILEGKLEGSTDFLDTNALLESSTIGKDAKSKVGYLNSQTNNYNVADYRSLVKTLVCGVKTITWGVGAVKTSTATSSRQFSPQETLVFVRLVKWALKALDIYTLQVGPLPTGAQRINQQTVRSKEEKEVLEHFSGVFSMMNAQTFHEIFSTTIEYLVERVYQNMTLQIVPNTLLANLTTSPIFATVLVEFLLERMDQMGSNLERSNLYLRLFKLVFGSVSLFPQENENMLRPHLHQIVNRSMELAMTAKEPYNYFLLLRALFRSIGGGSHDLLYQEFLPLLPNLLEGLNRLQSGLHKQHMKDLFVELCLTVPVRLSSLLPYLPMLMDPLVSALNGSHVLISQGLRTLELCVDNLQHDFLYEHIQPVRADLMQALWRTLRNNDQVAQVAFKVLGKFGGGNRKMMIEPQKLNYVGPDYDPPAIITLFYDHKHAIEFPVDKIIDTAFTALKVSTTDSFYRKQAWEVINCFLAASLNFNDDKNLLVNLFLHPSFLVEDNIAKFKGSDYTSINKYSRETHLTALTGMFIAAAIKELRVPVISTMVAVVRHYTIVAIAQQAGAFAIAPKANEQVSLDPLVLIDALVVIMGHDEKELCKPGELALTIMLQTATTILGSLEMACKLPLVEYMAEKMSTLCYERAWYSKLGGCIAIKFMFERCHIKWVYDHTFTFLKALLFVMMDLTGEVSSGALDMAKTNLEKMLTLCVKPIENGDTVAIKKQTNALNQVTHELVRQVTSPHTLIREQAMASLRLLAEKQNKSVTAIMEPFREVLADMVPPKKHLLKHQPAVAQMGLMDGNMFCTTLTPRLFTINMSTKEHELFINDLLHLCKTEDNKLTNYSCYKGISDFIPLRISALRVLAACHYLGLSERTQIFQVLYKTLEKPNAELQQTAFECLKIFITGHPAEKELVHSTMRPLLLTLGDTKSLTLNGVKMLSYLTQLFPLEFNEKLCEQLLEILKQLFESLVQLYKGSGSLIKRGDEEQKVVSIIGIYHQIPAASSKFIKSLSQLIIRSEQAMMIESSSPFRDVLMKFLLRYTAETMEIYLQDAFIKEPIFSRYLIFLIKHKEGKPFRDYIQVHGVRRLITMVLTNTHIGFNLTEIERNELQHQSIRIVSILIKHDDQWLSTQQELVEALKQVWCTDEFQERHKRADLVDSVHWKEPKLIVKILLHFFCHHPEKIDLLFQLLRAICGRFIPDFQFLKDFLENTVAQNYTIEWKRSAFFRFVDHFPLNTMSQELKAKVLQYIIIPSFAIGFERGETNKLVGSSPAPNLDSPDNIVSVFINKVIDPEIPFNFAVSDCIRISLLQFACLLVEQASLHIHDHDASNKAQGLKLRKLMTFAWPCLLGKNCVDPTTRYHGHLLLAHIIDKFAIHRKIVLQVFHSLLKAHALEARVVVRRALDILTPSMPLRMEEGYTMLMHWTKKIIVDEGHSMQQLFHILQLVVRHYNVYYVVRHNLVQHMVNSIQRLGFNPTATLEHRKLAVELAEVIIKWELYGIKEECEGPEVIENIQIKRPASDDSLEPVFKRLVIQQPSGAPGPSTATVVGVKPDSGAPIDRIHTDNVLNYLLRLACQVNEPSPANAASAQVASPGEVLSRRCVVLLKTALKPDVWPQTPDLKLAIFDKILLSVDSNTPNIGNICTALELMTFLLGVMKKDAILANFKQLQRGLGVCIVSSNVKIIKLVHGLLSKLMTLFPPERSSANVVYKYEELEPLYVHVSKVISEGLQNFEKNQTANPSTLFGTLMILKAACTNNNSYIDLIITPFMKVLSRLAKEHLQSLPEINPMISELLILCLDLVKTRVVVLGAEMRKAFIGSVLVGLIEKSTDIKIMKAITKILEEWMKNKSVVTVSQAPNLREKSILLSKMMQHVEKRFPDDTELIGQFLEIIHHVYTDEALRLTELTSKLEPAFLAGLRCSQPHIRAKFFKIFDTSMRKKLHDRLLYITTSQNWDAIGSHYWIKQCIEILISTVSTETRIQMSHDSSILPCITSVVNSADQAKKKEILSMEKNPSLYEKIEIKEEVLDMDRACNETTSTVEENSSNRVANINKLISKHYEFVEVSSNITTDRFLVAAAQLCHMDTDLAEQVWLQLFPRLWDILDEMQRDNLERELAPFITSGTHVIQKECHPSAINTFVEGLSRCNNPPQLIALPLYYLGKSHNLWHRIALHLENLAFDPSINLKMFQPVKYSELKTEQALKTEVLDLLSELYITLKEDDLWAGLWQKHAVYKETNIGIALEQHGFFEQAQAAYETCMTKSKHDVTVGSPVVSTYHETETKLWGKHWCRCAAELNQWDTLLEYSKNHYYDPVMIVDSAWRIPSWDVMKEALGNIDYNCPKELSWKAPESSIGQYYECPYGIDWKITLYGGYLLICNPEEKPLKLAEKYVETATIMCLNEWRRLPHIVSHIHLPLLQAAQQVMELQEAYQIHKGLLQGHQNSLHDMKAIVKTWRNRLPVVADDLRHWNDIFTWRQHHYQFIINHYENLRETSNTNSMLGVHASAQSIIYFGKMARKHKMTNLCLETLNKIYTISSVPIVDCFQKIRQQVKCYMQMASMNNRIELNEALDVINNTNIKYFNKDMMAEFYAYKGLLFALIGKSDEANKSCSAAIQMHDTSPKVWALYGEYLEQVFTKDPRNIHPGINAMCCYLHACRHQNEPKARKYLAKILWLLSYDDDKGSLMEMLDKYSTGVPPVLWVPWIPQLLNCLVQYEGNVILNLLLQVGRMFPQAVYFPIRTLYRTLRTATARKTNTAQLSQEAQGDTNQPGQSQESTSTVSTISLSAEASAIKATPAMIRCSKIMKVQHDIHTTVLSSLEGIADQMEWFRENWYEEVVRQLRQGLAKCYAIAFENRENVNEAKITPHILNFVKKLVSTFGIGIEYVSSSANVTFNSAASESLARRAEATYQDPVFKEMKSEFAKDFDFSNPGAMKLHNLICKLKKWIKVLENRSKMFIQSFLMEEKCRFLSNFTLKTADVELPGEFLLPKHTHYYVRITRFMPRVDIVQKHNCAARRLYIRGHNGKIYPYLVINDSGLADARREERVLQVLRMLNLYLGKQKETSRRFLHFTVPKVVAVSQQIRLVEDNPSSVSLLDIYKRSCNKSQADHDAPIQFYYEKLAQIQSKGMKASHQVYREILKGVQGTLVSKTILKKWATSTFPNATDYWQFRKIFTLQLSLSCFVEYVLHLTRLNPDMMYLHQDSGLVNISYFKFDVDDTTRELITTRPVPFRLTPNIVEFLSSVNITGPLTASMIATARCFVYPNFKIQSILRPIMRDEMMMVRIKKPEEAEHQSHDKLTDNEQLINSVNRAVTAIMNRLNGLAMFDGTDSKVGTLVTAASSNDNLCRMDPAWHPWL